MTRPTIPLWPLPFAVAATLLVAAHLAWWLSVRDGHVPYCIPYLEGCTSISRAARHGPGNHLFRLLVLPCAVLVALHWCAAGQRLRLLQARGGGALAWLGLAAAAALAVYATFLGTEGAAYQFLRRRGVVAFFACSYLAQLLFLRASAGPGPMGQGVRRMLVAICVAMLAVGLAHVAGLALLPHAVQDRLENALEWHLGLLLACWFLVQAWGWRREGFGLSFGVR